MYACLLGSSGRSNGTRRKLSFQFLRYRNCSVRTWHWLPIAAMVYHGDETLPDQPQCALVIANRNDLLYNPSYCVSECVMLANGAPIIRQFPYYFFMARIAFSYFFQPFPLITAPCAGITWSNSSDKSLSIRTCPEILML